MDHTDENYDQDHLGKLIQGVRNNFPDLLPNTRLPAIEKRRVLRHFGWERPRNEFLDDLGIVSVPKAVGGHIEHNARKILAALHYRHTGIILTDQSGTFVGWSQQGLPGVDDAHEILLSGMPELVVGSRVNTSIGDQFSYRWGVDSKINLFGFAAAFGTGLFMFGACAPWDIVQDKENWLRFGL